MALALVFSIFYDCSCYKRVDNQASSPNQAECQELLEFHILTADFQ